MRTRDELDRLWLEGPSPPRGRGTVRLVCVRLGDGRHVVPERVRVSPEHGVEGDRWERDDGEPGVQVTLMNARIAELVAGDHQPLHAAGDNLLVDLDLSEEALPPGSRLRVGAALLEVSEIPHTGCKKFSARFGLEALRWVNEGPARRRRGVNCRVLEGAEVGVGDPVVVVTVGNPTARGP